MAKTMNGKVLLLDGDVNSKYVSPWDKSTALLFGDAGSATIVSPCESGEWFFSFFTDGSKRDSLIIPSMGFKMPLTEDDLKYRIYEDGSKRRMVDLVMKGEDVFSYVVSTVPKFANEFMDELETSAAEFDFLILHQANAFMLRKLSKKLNFNAEKVPLSIHRYGNTSSVSIPLNICSELNQVLNNPKSCMLIGMGAGLSTGIAKVTIGPATWYGVKEVDF
jgi:3-oxoacyl-[acyl-carrier-protein] synthase-3